jgi:hypothetical protein
MNLVSLSALIDQLDCRIMINKRACLIQESLTGRKIGSGTKCRGLWYLDQDKSRQAVFPDVMNGVDKTHLKCDACEYAKHTRTSYVSRGLRSISSFTLVHSDVWTCPIT